jgi:hypothetical protein
VVRFPGRSAVTGRLVVHGRPILILAGIIGVALVVLLNQIAAAYPASIAEQDREP